MNLEKVDGGLRLAGPTLIGSPAYTAGLDLDDELLSVAGVMVASPDDLARVLAGHKPGDAVLLVFKRHGKEMQARASLATDLAMTLTPVEFTGTLTDEQERFREAWLSSKAGSHAD